MSSDRRPILFVGLPESGLLNPMLVLAGELTRRGVQDVWLATDEDRRGDVEALAAKSKVEFASLGETVSELSALTWDDETYRAVTQADHFKAHRAVLQHSYDPALHVGKFHRLMRWVDEIKPALMVVESMATFAVDVAVTRGIPYVLSSPFLPSNLVTSYVPFGKAWTPPDFPVPHTGLSATMTAAQRLENRLFRLRTMLMFLNPRMAKVLKQDARIRQELGIDPRARKLMGKIDEAELVFTYSIPELDYPFEIRDKMKMLGAMVPPLPQAPDSGELGRWLDAQDSVVYMGFGTITRLTEDQVTAFLEVARRLSDRHQVLWKLPEEQQHLLPPVEEIPGNVRIESWVPSQLDVLAHPNVKVFFNHAGGNAFHEGLYFGTPLVSRPLWVDCFDQAVRAEDFGVGLTLDRPETVDPDDVVDKLTRVLDDPSFREHAELMRERQLAAGGRVKAADLLLSLPALAGA